MKMNSYIIAIFLHFRNMFSFMLLADDLSSCFDETLFSSFISRYVSKAISSPELYEYMV